MAFATFCLPVTLKLSIVIVLGSIDDLLTSLDADLICFHIYLASFLFCKALGNSPSLHLWLNCYIYFATIYTVANKSCTYSSDIRPV